MRKINRFVLRSKLATSSLLLVVSSLVAALLPAPVYAVSNQGVVSLINNERAGSGLRALAWNASLSNSALLKAQHMCANNYWAHTGPDGSTAWTFIRISGYPYTSAAENLARGFTDDGSVVAGWMASSGHRSNILSATFADVGVATTHCTILGEAKTLVIAHFGVTGAAAPAQPKPAPKPAPKPQAQPQPKPVPKTTHQVQVLASSPPPAPVPAPPPPPKPNPYEKVRTIVWSLYQYDQPEPWEQFKKSAQ